MHLRAEGNKDRANERTKDQKIKKVNISFPSAAPYAIAFSPFSSPEGCIPGRILINWTLALGGRYYSALYIVQNFHVAGNHPSQIFPTATMALAPPQAPGSACKVTEGSP